MDVNNTLQGFFNTGGNVCTVLFVAVKNVTIINDK